VVHWQSICQAFVQSWVQFQHHQRKTGRGEGEGGRRKGEREEEVREGRAKKEERSRREERKEKIYLWNGGTASVEECTLSLCDTLDSITSNPPSK